jgi:Phage related hypothetical protein (DUF1799)
MSVLDAQKLKEQRANDASLQVEPELWDGLQLMIRCSTQWVLAVGMGAVKRVGLNYQGVQTVMQFMNIENPKAAFVVLQALEREILELSWQR